MNIQTRGHEKSQESQIKTTDEISEVINGAAALNGNSEVHIEEKPMPKPRKATRTTRLKAKKQNVKANNKGRGRRIKKPPFKTPKIHVETRVVESLFHNGSYVQVGDIVSLIDAEDNVYYAQIRGLLIDTYCEKSAYLTWLVPTTSSPPPNVRFDAATYLIGPEEESPRKLEYLEFIQHCPSDYYYDKTTPYPKPYFMHDEERKAGFIWTSLNDRAAPTTDK